MKLTRRFNGGLSVRAGLLAKPFQRFKPMNKRIPSFINWRFLFTRNPYFPYQKF